MSKIESSIGSVSYNEGHQQNEPPPMRRYVVDDPDMDDSVKFKQPASSLKGNATPSRSNTASVSSTVLGGRKIIRNSSISEDQELEIMKAYQDLKNKEAEPITNIAKTKLEILLGLRKKELPIIIEGHEFMLGALSAQGFQKLTHRIAMQTNGLDESFAVRNSTLAISLLSVDGESISSIIEETDELDLDTRVSVIENMAESVVSELWSFYQSNINVIPNSHKEVKEVMGNLKG